MRGTIADQKLAADLGSELFYEITAHWVRSTRERIAFARSGDRTVNAAADRMPPPWRPKGTMAAVCVSVDDLHPTMGEGGDAIGSAARRAIDHLEWLLARHAHLRVTLFTTADWRSQTATPPRNWRRRLPIARHFCYAASVLARGTLRLDRHTEFAAWLRGLHGVDFALHGVHHVRRGPAYLHEFAGRSRKQCRQLILASKRIIEAAGLPVIAGLAPPAWTAPPELLQAMADLDMLFITSARDLDTPIAPGAVTGGSGLRGVSLITPQFLPFGRLVHIATNFQATSSVDRAVAIVKAGGLLSVKAHLLKRLGSYEALDGLDRPYVEYLDRLFMRLEDDYGDRIWWTTMADIATHMRADVVFEEAAS